MRKLIMMLLVAALPGCSLIDAYLMAGFDPNEYMLVTQIRTDAETAKAQCTNTVSSRANAAAIAGKTQLFERYSEEIPRNSNGVSAAKSLNEIAQGLAVRYAGTQPVSPVFCKLKFEGIESSAKVIQHVVGNRPR
jgi:hypothetical protein